MVQGAQSETNKRRGKRQGRELSIRSLPLLATREVQGVFFSACFSAELSSFFASVSLGNPFERAGEWTEAGVIGNQVIPEVAREEVTEKW